MIGQWHLGRVRVWVGVGFGGDLEDEETPVTLRSFYVELSGRVT